MPLVRWLPRASYATTARRAVSVQSHLRPQVPAMSSFLRSPRGLAPTPAVPLSTTRSIQSSHGLTTANPAPPNSPDTYTTAYALFDSLWEAGITACFVNVGSDHPSILEAIVKGKRERPDSWPKLITCPSEITAISMADGYARVTGKPQAVLVHVDVGTQALAHGLHNASVGRVPVLILAGLVPYTESGELPGSRTEYSNWLQDAPDQKGLVRQYCRYTGEIHTGLNVKQNMARALQFASSSPKGPSYLVCAREVLAQEIKPYSLNLSRWVPIGETALPPDAVRDVAEALVNAERPLIITGYSGRDRRTPEILAALADSIPGIRVHDTGGSDVNIPFSNIASEGFRLGVDECTQDADVILLLDCDVPWIPSRNPPSADARIYHIDIDPLKQHFPVSFYPANGRWKADSFTALTQLVNHVKNDTALAEKLQSSVYIDRRDARAKAHQARMDEIASRPRLGDDVPLDFDNIGQLLKSVLPESTNFVIEAVTASHALHDQLQPTRPGSWINCGATGIGWSNGAALGVRMAVTDTEAQDGQDTQHQGGLVCQVVGDGSFMCAAPSSALWVGSKYQIPILTVVLNNGGWKAPRNSVKLVYPDGLGASATDDEINTGIRPSPNYAALAEAAAGSEVGWTNDIKDTRGWMRGVRVRTVGELKEALTSAVTRLSTDKKSMLVEVLL